MNESLITVRYVKALYESALEDNVLKKVVADISTLLEILRESPEFNELVESPVIKNSEKLKLFNQLFKDKLCAVSLQFLHLLVENNRIVHLKFIGLHFLSYYKHKQGIREAVITTAIPLSKEHKEEIYRFITKKFKVRIELTEKVDPGIIGGFVLRIEDQQINASLYSQLNKIRRELIHT